MSTPDLLELVFRDEETLLLTAGLVLGFTGIVCGSTVSIVKRTQRERTRREIAAYVAEGSLKPEQAAKLLDAGEKKCDWS